MVFEVLSNNENPLMGEGVSVVINREKRSLDVYQDGKKIDSIPMGAYDIFRPDHDASYISPDGVAWFRDRND